MLWYLMATLSQFVNIQSENWDDDLGNEGSVFSLITANGDVEEVS